MEHIVRSRVKRHLDDVALPQPSSAWLGHQVVQHGPAPEWTKVAFLASRVATREPSLFGTELAAQHVDLAALYEVGIKAVIAETMSRTRQDIGLVLIARQLASLKKKQEEWRQEVEARLATIERAVLAHGSTDLPSVEQFLRGEPGLDTALATVAERAKEIFELADVTSDVAYDSVLGGVFLDVEVHVRPLDQQEYRLRRRVLDKSLSGAVDPRLLRKMVVTTVSDA